MNMLFTYLLELNIALVILYVAYKIFFERDKNFVIRRIYLLGVIVLPCLMLLMPDSIRLPVSQMTPVSIDLESVAVFKSGVTQESVNFFSFGKLVPMVYLLILAFGLIKFLIQLGSIVVAIVVSDIMEINETTLVSSTRFHASSFFKYIFIDPLALKEDSFLHILEHETIHKRDLHSIDRILVELFVMINWFNPVAWVFRKSVIQNLEYLADSKVLRKGCDPMKYQLSILNQYLGSASISNQFRSQIKNRITMLNKDYKLGSSWKIAMMLPLAVLTFFAISCSDKEFLELGSELIEDDDLKIEKQASLENQNANDIGEVFYIVEEMPKFDGGDPALEFRKYIASNLRYPEIAVQNSVSGRVIIQFTVSKTGDVVNAIVVRSVDPALDKEALRVVMSSPKWTPGKQKEKEVSVLFTFPINFVMQ